MRSFGKIFALLFVLVFLTSLVTLQPVMIKAQTSNNTTIVNGSQVANITIQSPENMTYNANNVTLAFEIECDVLPIENVSLNFGSAFNGGFSFFTYGVVLDYSSSDLLNLILNYATNYKIFPGTPNNVSASFSSLGNNFYAGDTSLTDLAQGAHNVTIWVSDYHWTMSYHTGLAYPNYGGAVLSTVSFNVDSIPPYISILSPETKVYNSSDVALDFTINETISQISYSLDGNPNVTVTGNMTLTRLSYGAHGITVYATDETGNMGASETVSFTIAKPQLFPTATVVAVSVAVVVVVASLSLLLYRRHRKTANLSPQLKTA